jgi:hypothetical protein
LSFHVETPAQPVGASPSMGSDSSQLRSMASDWPSLTSGETDDPYVAFWFPLSLLPELVPSLPLRGRVGMADTSRDFEPSDAVPDSYPETARLYLRSTSGAPWRGGGPPQAVDERQLPVLERAPAEDPLGWIQPVCPQDEWRFAHGDDELGGSDELGELGMDLPDVRLGAGDHFFFRSAPENQAIFVANFGEHLHLRPPR